VAIGKAGQRRAEAQLAALGKGLVYISAGSRNISGVRTGSHAAITLTAEDAGAILAEVPRIQSCALQSDTSVSVVSPNGNWTTRARGISVSYLVTWRWTIVEGAAFTTATSTRRSPWCCSGARCASGSSATVRPWAGRADRELLLPGRRRARVKGQSPWGRNQDDVVFLPYTSAQRRIRGKGFASVDDIMCRAVPPAAVKRATAQITGLLRERHHIAPGDDDDFNIRHLEEAANADLEWAARSPPCSSVSPASRSSWAGSAS